MAPSVGSGSKQKGKLQANRDSRRSRSRNTSPTSSVSASVSLSTAQEHPSTTYPPYLQTPLNPQAALSDTAVEDILNVANGASSSHSSTAASLAANPNPPSAVVLKAIADTTRTQLETIIMQRGETCERLIRELAQKLKERKERDRMREHDRDRQKERDREREKERERERDKGNDDDSRRGANGKLKKGSSASRRQEREGSRHSPTEDEKARPMAVGAHGVARQDGVEVHKAESSSAISSPASHPPPSLPDTTNVKAEPSNQDPPSPTSTTDEHQPPPAPSVQQYQFFGDDPFTFPDSTVYHIRDVTPDMTDDERREIYSVAVFPESDLHDLTCGTPPDRDFSNARPANQIAANTFVNFVEPYVRPLTEEDKAFLLERGDREKAFIMPKRGPRHYKDIWKEEDEGLANLDPIPDAEPKNEARGDMDLMNDDVAESDEVSTGPVLSRLLSIMRSQGVDQQSTSEDPSALPNGHEMDIDPPEPTLGASQPNPETQTLPPTSTTQPPASLLPDWKTAPSIPKTDYSKADDRILQELRHLGFLSPTETPDYDAEMDDEVAARLRYLQTELRRVSILNGARKARLLEMTDSRLATQEWAGIADDLDTQLNQAYLKRNRNIGKKGGKPKKAHGSAGGNALGVAIAPGQNASSVGEPIRQLMERRDQWRNWLGPVVEFGNVKIPEGSIFQDGQLEGYIAREQEGWGEVEGEG